jgi:gas vesicle protein
MDTANERMLPGLGSFVVGIALGVTLGLLFAQEDGEAFRGKLARRLRALRALAAEKAGDLGALVIDAGSAEDREVTGRRRRRPGEEDASIV